MRYWLSKEGLYSIAHSYDFEIVTLSIGDSSEGGHSQRWGLGFWHVVNQLEVNITSICTVSSTARVSIVNGTRAGTTGKGGKGTVLASFTGNGDNLRPVDRVNPDLADCPFLSVVRNHDL